MRITASSCDGLRELYFGAFQIKASRVAANELNLGVDYLLCLVVRWRPRHPHRDVLQLLLRLALDDFRESYVKRGEKEVSLKERFIFFVENLLENLTSGLLGDGHCRDAFELWDQEGFGQLRLASHC